MNKFNTILSIVIITAVTFPAMVSAQYGLAPKPGDPGPDTPEGVDFVQNYNAQVPLDIGLTDHNGNVAPFSDYINNKPAILVLHYNNCPKLCNEVLNGLLDTMKQLRESDPTLIPGGQFNLVLVTIDPREPYTLIRNRRELFIRDYTDNETDDMDGIWFLTTSRGQGTDIEAKDYDIHKLAEAVGFKYLLRHRQKEYQYDPESRGWFTTDGKQLGRDLRSYDYQHASGIVVLTPEGVTSRYHLGIIYDPKKLKASLVDASDGQIGTWVEQFWQGCFVYDQVTDHYRPTMRLVAALFTPFMLLVVAITVITVIRARRESVYDQQQHDNK